MADSLPSYVPPAYRQWVLQAAAGTGLPANVVAAQIQLESGFNPRATSPVGAQGIAQFMPATYRAVGGQGSAYVPANALPAYITLMRQLLGQFSGNVSNALAAYNAGPGNLPAGAGYARRVLNNAGVSQAATAGVAGSTAAAAPAGQAGTTATPEGATPGTGGGSDAPSVIADSIEAALNAMIPGVPFGTFIGGLIRSADNVWTDLISPILGTVPLLIAFFTNLLKMTEWIINPVNWMRTVAAVTGTVLLILGLRSVLAAA